MKKLLSLIVLLLCAVVGAKAAVKVGFTSSISSTTVAAPTVTTQDYVTVTVARGSQEKGSNKGSMFWGSTTALTFSGTCERSKYNGAALPASFNDNVWTGAKFAILSGYKFTVSDIQVDIAGQDYNWYVKVQIINGDGTEVYNSGSNNPGSPKVSSKKQITATGQSFVLTGEAYVKVYYYYKASSQSDSKYLAIPELYLTGTIEENLQSKYTKPSIIQGSYDQPNGKYLVTLAVQNEEEGTINYSIDSEPEVVGVPSGTVLHLAPGKTVTAYVTGGAYSDSEESTLTTSAAPTLDKPTYTIGSYDLMKNLYSLVLEAAAGGITYTIDGTPTAYSGALQLAPNTDVEAYATQENMTQSATLSFSLPAAPVGGSSSSSTETSTYTSNVSYNMGAVTIPGACIAGQISSSTTPINNSIKTRCNQGLSDSKMGFFVNVNPSYTVTGIKIVGCSNQTSANTCTAVYVDGVAIDGFSPVSLPLAEKNGETGTISVTGINATNKIEFAFENAYQGQMNIMVTYEVSSSSILTAVSGFSKAFTTFCAPRNFTVTGAAVYKAQISGDVIVLTEIEGVIPAATGVIIAGDDAASYTLHYVSDEATTVENNDLQGINVRTQTSTLTGSSKLLALNSSEAAFQEYTGTYFPANKAYLLVANEARMLKMVFSVDNETTGVINMNDNGSKLYLARKFMKDGRLVLKTAKGVFNVAGNRIK